jgi:hypothetical protein
MDYNCEVSGHVGKVLKFIHKLEDGDVKEYPSLFGCTKCDKTSKKMWPGFGEYVINKNPCKENCNCFGCKVKTLQLNTGDAARDISDKKWNSELQAYRDARSQGMQPAGTRMKDITAAHEASETLGKAYNSETMPKAKDINKKSVEVLKEIGQI